MWFDSYNYVAGGYEETSWHKPQTPIIRHGVYLDTAPLFILVVGHFDKIHNRKYIREFESKDKKPYEEFDYDYLLAFLNSFGLGKYSLYITPQIFTEFIKHLWKIVKNKEEFKIVLEDFFCKKWYIKEKHLHCLRCINETDFLNKILEIGDISITILAKDSQSRCKTILTDDEPFAILSDTKYGFLTIYYNDIRSATIGELGSKNIPKHLLIEPIQTAVLHN